MTTNTRALEQYLDGPGIEVTLQQRQVLANYAAWLDDQVRDFQRGRTSTKYPSLILPMSYPPHMNYTSPDRLVVLYEVSGGSEGHRICVIGDPDNGSYEWLIQTPKEIRHSDCGYGNWHLPMRDAMVVYHRDFDCVDDDISSVDYIRTIKSRAGAIEGRVYWRYEEKPKPKPLDMRFSMPSISPPTKPSK